MCNDLLFSSGHLLLSECVKLKFKKPRNFKIEFQDDTWQCAHGIAQCNNGMPNAQAQIHRSHNLLMSWTVEHWTVEQFIHCYTLPLLTSCPANLLIFAPPVGQLPENGASLHNIVIEIQLPYTCSHHWMKSETLSMLVYCDQYFQMSLELQNLNWRLEVKYKWSMVCSGPPAYPVTYILLK